MNELHRITIPTPFHIGETNCYVFTGNGLTILDPGPATDDGYSTVRDGLDDLGYALGDIERILVTHPHIDHYGIASRIAAEADACVFAHADATDRLTDPLAHFHAEQAFFEPFLSSMGVPADLTGEVVGMAEPYLDFQNSVTVDRELVADDIVDVGVALRTVHTPGHAPGSVCFVSSDRDVAFTGDHVMSEISPNPLLTLVPRKDGVRTRSLPAYITSLRRLRLTGITTGYGGHRPPVNDLLARIGEIYDHHMDRKERIVQMLRENGRMTAYSVMQELFPDLPTSEVFAGMSEVIGHLDLLEDEERVERRPTDSTTYYELV